MSTGLHINERRTKHLPLWIFSGVVTALIGLFGWYSYLYYTTGTTLPVPIPVPIASANQDAIETEITPDQLDNYQVAPGQPRYLSVQALGITKARVLPVGITGNHELATPDNIHDAGWFEEAGAPGDGSSAVLIDGHNGGPTKGGIFENLGNLNIGDTIEIERGDGKTFTYVVKENKSISVHELNNGVMKEMTESIEPAHQGLNVISCTGKWIPQQKTYDKRQVVRAVLQN